MPPPALIGRIVRPCILILKPEISAVIAVFVDIRAILIHRILVVDLLSVHPFVERAAVVKHTIQNHADSARMCFLHKLYKQLVARLKILSGSHTLLIFRRFAVVPVARRETFTAILDDPAVVRIDIVIILAVIFMVGGGDKQRIEIDRLDAEILQIVQLFTHALKITAVKLSNRKSGRHLIPVVHPAAAVADIKIFIILYIIRRIAVAEAVYKNLVHDRTLCPVRRMESGLDAEIILRTALRRHAAAVVKAVDQPRTYLKIIAEALCAERNHDTEIVKFILCLRLSHGDPLFPTAQPDDIDIVDRSTKPDDHGLPCLRLRRNAVVCRSIRKQAVLLQYRSHLHHILHLPVHIIGGIFSHIVFSIS